MSSKSGKVSKEKQIISRFLESIGIDEMIIPTKMGVMNMETLMRMYEAYRANGGRNYEVLSLSYKSRTSKELDTVAPEDRVQYEMAMELAKLMFNKGAITFMKNDDESLPYTEREAILLVAVEKPATPELPERIVDEVPDHDG